MEEKVWENLLQVLRVNDLKHRENLEAGMGILVRDIGTNIPFKVEDWSIIVIAKIIGTQLCKVSEYDNGQDMVLDILQSIKGQPIVIEGKLVSLHSIGELGWVVVAW